MAAPYAAAAGLHRPAQEAHGAGVIVFVCFQLFDAGLRLIREQFGDNFPGLVVNPLRRTEADHFLRLQLDGQLGGDLLRSQVKALAGDRHRDRPHQDNGAAVELTMNRLFVNAANASAVAIIDAVIDAQRLGDDKVAADNVDMGPLQRGVVEAHRQAGGDLQLQHPRRLLNQLQRFGVSHSRLLVIDRLVVVLGEVSVNLRAGAIDHHQANAQAMQ